MKKRYLAIALVFMLVCLPCPRLVSAQTQTAAAELPRIVQAAKLYHENARYSMRLDEKSCIVYIVDRSDGYIWSSNPEGARQDEVAEGMYKTNLLSQLVITYTAANGAQKQMNNYAGSIGRGTFTISGVTNGVRIDFKFEKELITIPVVYTLEEDGLRVQVLLREIGQTGENRLNTAEILPYFGAADAQDSGYMFIPDGCGALMYLNSGKTSFPSYDKMVYGEDETLETLTQTSRQEEIHLPVFGMKKGEHAFLAVISKGAALCAMEASTAGKNTSYNNVNVRLTYRTADLIRLMDQLSGTKDVLYNAEDAAREEELEIRYSLLRGAQADYSGMAACYRSILQQQGMTKADDAGQATLYADFYGGIPKQKSFLGFVYEGKQALTSFDQAITLLNDLKAGGVDSIAVGLKNYSDDFFNKQVESTPSPASFLGGTKGFSRLLAYARDNQLTLYPSAGFTVFEKSGNSFMRYFDAVRGLDLGPAVQRYKDLNTNIKSNDRPPYYLLMPEKFGTAAQHIADSLASLQVGGVLLEREGNLLYSNFAIGGYQRDRAVSAVTDAADNLRQKYKLMVSAPNAYMLPVVDCAADVPLTSSRYSLFDEDVPFYQMVLKGFVSYSSKAFNLDDSSPAYFLRHIETASNLHAAFTFGEGDLVMDTEYTDLYGAYYYNWDESVKERAQEIRRLYAAVGNAEIVSHRKADGVAQTVYSNGVSVYVNYTDSDVNRNGLTVPAMGYASEGVKN